MFTNTVERLLKSALNEHDHLFLIDFKVTEANAISVVIDGDKGVSVNDCITISRAIEHNLDREEVDFSLEVTSAGVTAPLTHLRQYKKNIGRHLTVQTEEELIKGELAEVLPTEIVLRWKAREPKPVGKGKVTVNKETKIAFSNIKEAKVELKF